MTQIEQYPGHQMPSLLGKTTKIFAATDPKSPTFFKICVTFFRSAHCRPSVVEIRLYCLHLPCFFQLHDHVMLHCSVPPLIYTACLSQYVVCFAQTWLHQTDGELCSMSHEQVKGKIWLHMYQIVKLIIWGCIPPYRFYAPAIKWQGGI